MKKILVFVVAVATVLTLASCGGSGNEGTETTASGDVVVSPESVKLDKIPDQYSISYGFSFTDGDTSADADIVVSKAANGVYAKLDFAEVVYLVNEEGYQMYSRTGGADGFTKVNGKNGKLTNEQMDEYLASYNQYFAKYGSLAGLTKGEAKTVAGRECTVYTQNAEVGGASAVNYYAVDKDTDICLEFYTEIGGKKSGYGFVCTEFKTEGIEIPSVE